LPSVFYWTLGKAFAERLGGVGQRKAAVTAVSRRDAFLAECIQYGARQRVNFFFKKFFFAECLEASARQRANQIFFETFFAERLQ
jgi:hypothetical protein